MVRALRRSFILSLLALLIGSAPLFGDTNERRVTKLADGVYYTHFHNDHNNGNKTYLDEFPSLAIIAQEETKKDMDLIQPGNIERAPREIEAFLAAFRMGRGPDGHKLSEDEKKQYQAMIPGLKQVLAESKTMFYQAPTLVFTDKLDIDLGHREVRVKHLGRGNTAGDAIVYLPKEKILVAGDLLVIPIPFTYDGYPPA